MTRDLGITVMYLLMGLTLLAVGCTDSANQATNSAADFSRPIVKDPKPADNPQAAARFFLDQRLGPGHDRYPFGHLRTVLDELRSREAAAGKAAAGGFKAGGLDTWAELGPGNIGGRTRAFAIDPLDSNILYAGGVAGGIWKSTDRGASWRVADDLMLNLAITTIAIDPSNPEILYAGTGEGFLGESESNFLRGLGIFKSTDSGESWHQLPATVSGQLPEGAFTYVNDLVISPNDPQRIYAATVSGVWRSDDGGDSWTVILANLRYIRAAPYATNTRLGCTELAIRSDSDPDVLLAAFGGLTTTDGLYRTSNGGASWTRVLTAPDQGRISLAIAPSDNDIVYACMAQNLGGAWGQVLDVFRSTDGGATWEPRLDFENVISPWLLSNLPVGTGCFEYDPYSQGWYDNVIAVDPMDPEVVWVGGIEILRSTDGASTFELAGYWFTNPAVTDSMYIHADQHFIVFDHGYNGTTNQMLYVGGDGGIWRTENARAATSPEDCPMPPDQPLPEIIWENLNNGYAVTQFYHGDSAKHDDVFVGGTQDNGTNMVSAQGSLNSWQRVFGGDGGYVAIDPTDSRIIYLEMQFFPAIFKSIDGGRNFFSVINGITDTGFMIPTPFAMDQSAPSVLWSGSERPWRTTDGALWWNLAGPNFVSGSAISAIAIAPGDSDIVYMGLDTGEVARTSNGLDPEPTWTVHSAGLPAGWVSSIAVDPENPEVAYCTYSTFGVDHIWRTADGGETWEARDGIATTGVPDIPVHWLAIRPCNSYQLYAGTEFGVFASDDQGLTWHPVNTGLAHTVVESLDFKDNDTLVAFTHGRGAFLAHLTPCQAIPPRRPGGRQTLGN